MIPISELTTNIFDGMLPDWLAALPQLSELYVGGNYFTGTVPPALGDVAARFTNMCGAEYQHASIRTPLLTPSIPPSQLVGP